MGYNRRHFIGNSLAVTTALLLPSLDIFGSPKFVPDEIEKGFSLKIMAPYWGFNGSVTDFCKKAKHDEYDGIEILWPSDLTTQKELFIALKEYQLAVGRISLPGRRINRG
ncbi:hypothetical protein [Pedobacter sp. NJ-S-72]